MSKAFAKEDEIVLFLVQTRHDGAHCPGYHPELLPKWLEALDRREEIAAQLGVKLHGVYSAMPEHLEIAIVEADAPTQVGMLITQLLPSEQAEIKVTPITSAEDMVALARRMTSA
jgi:hypothetical protein